MAIVTRTSDVLNKIAAEHRALHTAVDRLFCLLQGGPRDVPAVIRQFDRLVGQFAAHFAHEEEGGYYTDAVENQPRLARTAQILRQEHVDLLDTLVSLCNKAHALGAAAPKWSDVERQFEDFIRRCEVHEEAENEMVQDAYTQDIGNTD